MAKYRDLLKERNFFLYSLGQFVSQFGDRLVQMILVGLIYKLSPGSTMKLAKAFSFTLIPAFFVSPLAGVWVDRWNNKNTMIVCDIIRCSLMLTFPAFLVTDQLLPIYTAIFCIFTCACFFLPAKFAIIPDLVSKDKLLLANSMSTIITLVGGVAGITVGGLILEVIGIQKTIYLNAIIYLASAACLSLIAYRSKKDVKKKVVVIGKKIREAFKTPFLYELKEGLKYLIMEKRVRFVIFVLFFSMSMVGAVYVVSAVFIQEVMGSMTKDIGLFGSFLCVGMLIGSYFYGKFGQGLSKDNTIYGSIVATGVLLTLFTLTLSATASFFLGSFLMFLIGLAAFSVMISANTIIHEDIDDSMRGRIFSSIGIVMNVGLIVFMFAASSLAEIVGKIWILLSCGIIFGVFGLFGLIFKRRRRG